MPVEMDFGGFRERHEHYIETMAQINDLHWRHTRKCVECRGSGRDGCLVGKRIKRAFDVVGERAYDAEQDYISEFNE